MDLERQSVSHVTVTTAALLELIEDWSDAIRALRYR